jgi:hypothetical protein
MKTELFRRVPCEERLPDKEDYYDTDKGELYYYFPDDNHAGWCAYETRPMSAEYPTIWLEPVELVSESAIFGIIQDKFLDYSVPYCTEVAKFLHELIYGKGVEG